MLTDDFIPLINVIRPGEEDAAPDHLSHDAAHRPDVHVLLVAHPQDDLGGAVVPRDDVGRHHEGGAGRPRQSEVEDLQRAVRSHDDVRRFQVSVWSEMVRLKKRVATYHPSLICTDRR